MKFRISNDCCTSPNRISSVSRLGRDDVTMLYSSKGDGHIKIFFLINSWRIYLSSTTVFLKNNLIIPGNTINNNGNAPMKPPMTAIANG
jgi:hypothetical protein